MDKVIDVVERYISREVVAAYILHKRRPIARLKACKSCPGVSLVMIGGEATPHVQRMGAEAAAEAHGLPHEEVCCHQVSILFA